VKQIIIGTAGHVDHGKTCLIRALTGMDTDRLAEEKRRGITVDLGFAHMTLPDGTQAGIMDVPGHERFIKNMLAGAGCIDLVLMTVAADEGVKPQTAEHLEILSLLGIRHGIVVLTKADLVDAEGLALAKQEVAERFAGSFLAEAPVLAVSSQTGAGINALRTAITVLAAEIPPRGRVQPFRLSIDRVFTLDGFGTVATGVVTEGVISVGDSVSIYPDGGTARVRGLQSYGNPMEKVMVGQRAAINLAGVKKQELQRGDVLAEIDSLNPTMLLDVKLITLPSFERAILNNQRVHLFIGTVVVLCRIVLFGISELKPGENGYAQLRLESPVAVKNGDRFVVRFYSPLQTIGGGVVLSANPQRHKRGDAAVLQALRIADTGTPREQIMQLLSALPGNLQTREQIRLQLPTLTKEQFERELQMLLQNGKVIETDSKLLVFTAYLQKLSQRAQELLVDYHKRNPLEKGMFRQELRVSLFGQNPSAMSDQILSLLEKRNTFTAVSQSVALPTFCREQTPLYLRLREHLIHFYNKQGFVPSSLKPTEVDECENLLRVARLLVQSGELIELSAGCYLAAVHYHAAVNHLKRHLTQNSSITLAQYRDLLGISRKPAQQLLEYFDATGITQKIGDERTLK